MTGAGSRMEDNAAVPKKERMLQPAKPSVLTAPVSEGPTKQQIWATRGTTKGTDLVELICRPGKG